MDRARRQYLLGIVVTGFVILTVFLVFAPSQALLNRSQSQGLDVLGEFAPQGWAFFTKDPRGPYVSLYQRHGQGWEQANSTTVAGGEHLFGLDRSARTESYEIGVITGAITEEEWTACDEELITRCLPESPETGVSVDSYGEDLRFCGVLAVTRQEPVPWAWADLVEQMPGDYAVVDVECHDFERGQFL
ncbi:SdpA family antimicrobial peptide system protein [Nocardiopsis deserti]|uniref:SdpA family antimicrobial peptide system protein n=1 Tax=Nocardiopsis deserti TaxID=2605988 RepID=UPI00123A1A22|nr:SdpA family antimicrobial peptide system protein [Nocardiopsis deserti]